MVRNFSQECSMYFKKNWGSMAEKDHHMGVLTFFKQVPTPNGWKLWKGAKMIQKTPNRLETWSVLAWWKAVLSRPRISVFWGSLPATAISSYPWKVARKTASQMRLPSATWRWIPSYLICLASPQPLLRISSHPMRILTPQYCVFLLQRSLKKKADDVLEAIEVYEITPEQKARIGIIRDHLHYIDALISRVDACIDVMVQKYKLYHPSLHHPRHRLQQCHYHPLGNWCGYDPIRFL